MVRYDVISAVKSLAQGVADAQQVDLVDIELLGKGSRTILRVTIDREEGVNLRDCEEYSRELEALLDVEDPIANRYTLEVSSPGIDRPLRKLDDFIKYRGKKSRVVIDGKIENQSFFIGTIEDVRGGEIFLALDKKTVAIPFDRVIKAKLEIEF